MVNDLLNLSPGILIDSILVTQSVVVLPKSLTGSLNDEHLFNSYDYRILNHDI